jgi:hypothetical protein
MGVFKIQSHEIFARLASNRNPDLCLLSSYWHPAADSFLSSTVLRIKMTAPQYRKVVLCVGWWIGNL